MKKNKSLLLLLILIASLLLVAQSVYSDEGKAEAVTLNVMGEEITYEKIPEKVVVVGYENVENMALLGLEDKVVGFTPCMYLPEHVYPELLKKMDNLKVLPEVVRGVPGMETVLAEGADMVYGQSYHFAEASSTKVATLKDLLQNNIYPYATVGSYGDSPDLDVVYKELENLGKIFRVEERAAQEIEKLKSKQESVEEKLKGFEPKTAFVFDFQDKTGIMTPGGTGFQNNLLKRAGLKNVFDNFNHFDVATHEQILLANPNISYLLNTLLLAKQTEKLSTSKVSPNFREWKLLRTKIISFLPE